MIAEQIIQNGGFEEILPGGLASGWMCDPDHPTTFIGASGPFSGAGGARFGNWGEVADAYLYQIVSVPENCIATLSFYLSIEDVDAGMTISYNTLTIKIQDESGTDLKTLASWDNLHPDVGMGYRWRNFDLSNFAGQRIRVYFLDEQTDAAKNSLFYVDEVRLDTLLRLPVSSWPPLVSDKSRDLVGAVQQYGSKIYCSCLIQAENTDQFFNPAFGGGLTGYGANGSYYTDGIEDPTNKAEWWSEAAGGGDQTTRGAVQSFPSTAVVLVSEGSISILDPSDSMSMWMVFIKKANNAYSDNFGLTGGIYRPTSVAYDSGLISVTFEPQEGSALTNTVVLGIDFVTDFVFCDTSQ